MIYNTTTKEDKKMKRVFKKLTENQLTRKLNASVEQQTNHPHQSGRDGWKEIEKQVRHELTFR